MVSLSSRYTSTDIARVQGEHASMGQGVIAGQRETGTWVT